MKKFLNDPKEYVDEMLAGILAAHPESVRQSGRDCRCVVRTHPAKNKVALVTGGGSGHLPLFLGYVGPGLLDGCAVGGVFQSPSADQWYCTAKAADTGRGVLFIYGNYSGDSMNYAMAKEMLEADGVLVDEVRCSDDVASAPKGEERKRLGGAGIFYLYKCAGALAETGADFDQVRACAQKAGASVRTVGVALTPCTIPEAGRPGFLIGEGEMEMGMGIHGEPGLRRGALLPADAVVDEMLRIIMSDLSLMKGDEVSVLVNGLGATPYEELYIAFGRVHERLTEEGIALFKAYVGEFATSMEMTGLSISLLKLDSPLKQLLAAPAGTPFFTQTKLPV